MGPCLLLAFCPQDHFKTQCMDLRFRDRASIYIYMYIYITQMYVCIYIYIYIYTHSALTSEPEALN